MKFQRYVRAWVIECFGEAFLFDTRERNHRFLEEAIELVQACNCTRAEAHELVDYVFDRPAGEKFQEAGGVQMTLAALCACHMIDMAAAAEAEAERIFAEMPKIKAHQAEKRNIFIRPKDARSQLDDCTDAACAPGNYDANPYMHGLANGLILAQAILKGVNPKYLDVPDLWLDELGIEATMPDAESMS